MAHIQSGRTKVRVCNLPSSIGVRMMGANLNTESFFCPQKSRRARLRKSTQAFDPT